MLHLNDVTLRIGGRLLLEGASVHLPAGHRVGLVGRNGSGKTTLLRLIRGDLAPDAGAVRLRRGARVDWVAQEAPGGERTPRQAVLDADLERGRLLRAAERAHDPGEIGEIHTRLADIGAHAAPARASAILAGLGFDDAAQERPLAAFSGGWRMRVALAAVLFAEPDLLLLDEPTNHLDLEASLWLEDYLCRYPRTLLLISHDRHLLNRVPERIVHLDQRKLTGYTGGYDAFERVRREKSLLQAKERTKQEAKRKHMQAFVDRFRYKASKARQAQSRLKALARLEPIAEVIGAPDVVLRFPAPAVPPPPLITLERVRAGYGPTIVLERLDLRIDPDDRIALLGANGNGKSTFAKLLAGRIAPLAGEIVRAPKLRVGYFAQHQIEDLHPERTALQHLAEALPEVREQHLRSRLGAFGLIQEKADLAAGLLSGGEKARLTLALISAERAPDPGARRADQPPRHRLARRPDRGDQRIPWRRPADQPRSPSDRPDRGSALAGRPGPHRAVRGRSRRLPQEPAGRLGRWRRGVNQLPRPMPGVPRASRARRSARAWHPCARLQGRPSTSSSNSPPIARNLPQGSQTAPPTGCRARSSKRCSSEKPSSRRRSKPPSTAGLRPRRHSSTPAPSSSFCDSPMTFRLPSAGSLSRLWGRARAVGAAPRRRIEHRAAATEFQGDCHGRS